MNLWRRFRHLWMLFRYSGTEYARRCGVEVGEGCRIITREFGTEPFLIRIGHRVTVTGGVRFLTHDGAHWLVRDQLGRRYRYGRIEIGDDVFIGAGAILLPSIRIGSRSIVAAGAVVAKSVPAGSIVAGVPATVIGQFEQFESTSLTSAVTDYSRQGQPDFKQWVLSVVEGDFVPELQAPNGR